MWGNDFPHPEGTWPHTRKAIAEAFADVPPDEATRMLGANAAAVYRFDVGKLQPLAARIGPSRTDVHGASALAAS
jgi:hypothetical protein